MILPKIINAIYSILACCCIKTIINAIITIQIFLTRWQTTEEMTKINQLIIVWNCSPTSPHHTVHNKPYRPAYMFQTRNFENKWNSILQAGYPSHQQCQSSKWNTQQNAEKVTWQHTAHILTVCNYRQNKEPLWHLIVWATHLVW